MIGKIIDVNFMDATIVLRDGSTLNTSIQYLPSNFKIGDKVNIEPLHIKFTEKDSVNISVPPLCWILYNYVL